MKKWIIAIICFLSVLASSLFYYQSQISSPPPIVQPQPTVGIPKNISIPSLKVSATIEPVGLDEKNRMDIPKDFNNVAWYNLGFRPGEKGSAVIDGHVDTPMGTPAVFANITNLQKGSLITIQDSDNHSYTFTVTKIVNYPFDSMPLQTIFNSIDKPRLNLITCAGKWDRLTKNYSERTVVFAEME